MEQRIFSELMKAQEELKEITTEYYVLQYQLRKLKGMVLCAALESVDRGYRQSINWDDIQSVFEWSDIEDAVAAYKANKEEEENEHNV